ncbi:MAG TPA: hypothetical protein VF306_03845 [Pirellulales bacterium]
MFTAVWLTCLCWQPSWAIADEPADASRIAVEQDPDTLTTRVLIEAKDGKISWADLWAGLAKAKGYDADFHHDHPDVRLRMITLSMGGLVARRALEVPALDPKNVVQLVMIGPPNHGSALAYCGFGLQIWQFLDDPKARSFAERFYHTIDQLRDRVKQAEERHRFLQFLGPKIDRVLVQGDELVHGKGDGAVAIERGKLEHVEDTLVIEFDHLSMGRRPQTDGERQLREGIVKRLQEPLPK